MRVNSFTTYNRARQLHVPSMCVLIMSSMKSFPIDNLLIAYSYTPLGANCSVLVVLLPRWLSLGLRRHYCVYLLIAEYI